jgi:hypothetical protein
MQERAVSWRVTLLWTRKQARGVYMKLNRTPICFWGTKLNISRLKERLVAYQVAIKSTQLRYNLVEAVTNPISNPNPNLCLSLLKKTTNKRFIMTKKQA